MSQTGYFGPPLVANSNLYHLVGINETFSEMYDSNAIGVA